MDSRDSMKLLFPDVQSRRSKSSYWAMEDLTSMIRDRIQIEELYHDNLMAFSARYRVNRNILYPSVAQEKLKVEMEADLKNSNEKLEVLESEISELKKKLLAGNGVSEVRHIQYLRSPIILILLGKAH